MDNIIQPSTQLPGFEAKIAQLNETEACIDEGELSCLSAEVDNYNILLKNYQEDLYRWLCNANSFNQFEQRVTDEMVQLGLRDWYFIQLQKTTDPSLNHRPGHSPDVVEAIIGQVFFECDIVLQHATASTTPVYQSQVEEYVKSAPFFTELMERYLMLLAMIKQSGCADAFSIPVVGTGAPNSSRCVFCVTSKDMDLLEFRECTAENREMLEVIARVVNDVGAMKHANNIVDAQTYYQQLTETQPFRLIKTMINCDLGADDRHQGISTNTVVEYLARIRQKILKR